MMFRGMSFSRVLPILLTGVAAGLPGCAGEETNLSAVNTAIVPGEPYKPLANFGPMDIPADNPMTQAKVELGRQLYYDSRLSGDGSRSCYSCHLVEHGLTDGRAQAIGAYEKQLTRSSPTLWNIGFHSLFYWDGRAPSLEVQAAKAWSGGNMGAGDDVPAIVEKINAIAGYKSQFEDVFAGPATKDNIPQALAAYMRTLVSGNTAFDRWQAGDEGAVSDGAKRGYEVFQKAKCGDCHSGTLFTDMVFHNVGIGYDSSSGEFADIGRFKVTSQESDTGAFKTPTLRDISKSAPYFHDGSVATLDSAVRVMAMGGIPNPHKDIKLKPANLEENEIQDLLEFLETLDEDTAPTSPELP